MTVPLNVAQAVAYHCQAICFSRRDFCSLRSVNRAFRSVIPPQEPKTFVSLKNQVFSHRIFQGEKYRMFLQRSLWLSCHREHKGCTELMPNSIMWLCKGRQRKRLRRVWRLLYTSSNPKWFVRDYFYRSRRKEEKQLNELRRRFDWDWGSNITVSCFREKSLAVPERSKQMLDYLRQLNLHRKKSCHRYMTIYDFIKWLRDQPTK